MKMWEIIKGMSNRDYSTGQIFTSPDCIDVIINDEEELVWVDDLKLVSMLLGDDIDNWELKPKEMDWELKITEKYGN